MDSPKGWEPRAAGEEKFISHSGRRVLLPVPHALPLFFSLPTHLDVVHVLAVHKHAVRRYTRDSARGGGGGEGWGGAHFGC